MRRINLLVLIGYPIKTSKEDGMRVPDFTQFAPRHGATANVKAANVFDLK